jgi:hypothetical protein
MRRLPLLCTVALAGTMLAAPLDPAGDTGPAAPGSDMKQYDLRSADIATDARQLTVAIRLAGLSAEDTKAFVGRVYEFDFAANGNTFELIGALLTGGTDFEAYVVSHDVNGSGRTGDGLGQISGVVDVAHRQLRMTAPLRLFAPYANFRQTAIDHLDVTSAQAQGEWVATPPDGQVTVSQSNAVVVDEATSSARYVPGQRSCLAVGR